MTPKEKAIELIESMAFSCRECDYESNAKQCALIAVDEILEATKVNWATQRMIDGNWKLYKGISYKKYWQEVKQEIELL